MLIETLFWIENTGRPKPGSEQKILIKEQKQAILSSSTVYRGNQKRAPSSNTKTIIPIPPTRKLAEKRDRENQERMTKKKNWELAAKEKNVVQNLKAVKKKCEDINKWGRCLHCLQVCNKMLMCSLCRLAEYCGRGCQRDNWMSHKKVCRRLKELWWGTDRGEVD